MFTHEGKNEPDASIMVGSNFMACSVAGVTTIKNPIGAAYAVIIVAGTYASDTTCGVSATEWGEYFIRPGVTRDIAALMEYGGLTVQQASDSVVMRKLPTLGGIGGTIALDRKGNFAMIFCTSGRFRGNINRKRDGKVFMYKD